MAEISDNRIFEDAFNLLCGKLLGQGIHRKVFACKLRDDLVVKVEYETEYRYFANVIEDRFYSNASEAAKLWLAPCTHLSPDGRLLLQRRVQPIADPKALPERVPAFLGDVKTDNFGMLDGRLVCMDYVYTNMPNPSMKLVSATWGPNE